MYSTIFCPYCNTEIFLHHINVTDNIAFCYLCQKHSPYAFLATTIRLSDDKPIKPKGIKINKEKDNIKITAYNFGKAILPNFFDVLYAILFFAFQYLFFKNFDESFTLFLLPFIGVFLFSSWSSLDYFFGKTTIKLYNGIGSVFDGFLYLGTRTKFMYNKESLIGIKKTYNSIENKYNYHIAIHTHNIETLFGNNLTLEEQEFIAYHIKNKSRSL